MKAVEDTTMQMRWCYPFPEIVAFKSFKKAKKYAKKRFDVDMAKVSSGQCDTFISDSDIEPVCIVVVTGGDNPSDRYALLAHECVHVVHSWLDYMGVQKPDEEQVAYGVQSAMQACIHQIGEEWFLR